MIKFRSRSRSSRDSRGGGGSSASTGKPDVNLYHGSHTGSQSTADPTESSPVSVVTTSIHPETATTTEFTTTEIDSRGYPIVSGGVGGGSQRSGDYTNNSSSNNNIGKTQQVPNTIRAPPITQEGQVRSRDPPDRSYHYQQQDDPQQSRRHQQQQQESSTRTRSISAHRASQLLENGGGISTLNRRSSERELSLRTDRDGTAAGGGIAANPQRMRARSVGRPVRHIETTHHHPMILQHGGGSLDSSDVGTGECGANSEGNKKRKSKIEKIRQLQAKNELYKEEFKRVQKDRKRLRKELEAKNNEIESMGKEIDNHIAETSRLKGKLSDALKEIEQIEEDAERDKSTVEKLAKELAQTKQELSQALSRVSTLTDDVTDLREYVRRKDEQIDTLSREMSEQEERIMALEDENQELVARAEKGAKDGGIVNELVEENKKLQEELGATLKRAANMVKEREDAISDLLRENDEIKELLSKKENNDQEDTKVTQEQLDHLREELDTVNASLEHVQDRNVLLEEEIEAWLNRGTEMEGMLDKLNKDLEEWQKKASGAEKEVEEMQRKLVDAKAETESARAAITKAEVKHKEQIADLEAKHKAVLAEIQEKALLDKMEKSSNTAAANLQQDMLLQAVAKRQQGKSSTSGWRRFLTKSDDEEDKSLDDNEKRIKQLEKANATQEEEIKQLKSEMVRLRSTYNEASYMSKKKIERLTEENEELREKIAAFENGEKQQSDCEAPST